MNEGRNISMVNMKMIYIEIVTSMLHELSGMKEVSSQIWDEGFAFYQVIDRLGTPEEMEEKPVSTGVSCEDGNEIPAEQQ